MIEDEELSEVVKHCDGLRHMMHLLINALQQADRRLQCIERQCNIWDFRKRYEQKEEQYEN